MKITFPTNLELQKIWIFSCNYFGRMTQWNSAFSQNGGGFQFKFQRRTWPGFWAQPCYEAPIDLQIELDNMQRLTLDEWYCLLGSDPKLSEEWATEISCIYFKKLVFQTFNLYGEKKINENRIIWKKRQIFQKLTDYI